MSERKIVLLLEHSLGILTKLFDAGDPIGLIAEPIGFLNFEAATIWLEKLPAEDNLAVCCISGQFYLEHEARIGDLLKTITSRLDERIVYFFQTGRYPVIRFSADGCGTHFYEDLQALQKTIYEELTRGRTA